MAEQTLKAVANKEKCEGIRCAFKASCGRYLRPEAENQAWASFYAIAGDDCEHFEATHNV